MRKNDPKRLKYAADQHDLICSHLKVGKSPTDGGPTAFEAVVKLEQENERFRSYFESANANLKDLLKMTERIAKPYDK